MAVNGDAPHNEPSNVFDTILVLDFGSQYTRLLIRRLRDFNVFCEMLPCTTTAPDISSRFDKLKGIILSGSPASVYAADAPHVDPAIFELKVPILGICYGMQEIAWHSSRDNVCAGEQREYGHATLDVSRSSTTQAASLFDGVPDNMVVWMSHGDKLSALPSGFVTIATTANAPFAGIMNEQGTVFGIQFHPEVTHTAHGPQILKNFAVNICHAQQNWTMENFVETEIARIRAVVGEKGQVIGAVSGGVDSSVAARLVSQAIGNRFHAVFVDNGLLRENEMETVKKTLGEHLGVNLTVIDASERFLNNLKSISDPERKRKIIGNLFIETFQDFAKTKAAEAADSAEAGDIEFLLQGTLYPDVIESGQVSFHGHSNASVIKSHHNVGGLLKGMHLKLVEPLRELFKDECRELGRQLGLPDFIVNRHPFPGPGLGIRILGEVTASQLKILRHADNIFIQEIKAAGLYDQISQALVGLLPVKAVGVMGDARVHEQVVALRAVVTTDFMTAHSFRFDWNFIEKVSTRIVNEVDGICRVFYDITSKPPGTIEFE